MTQIQTHRGIDEGAIWLSKDRDAGLGHRRLRVIDLSMEASQPMVSKDKRYVITYNGEIFNYVSLRKELSMMGHEFRSKSDTEVLLEGYAEWGKGIISRIEGQFAFTIWDTKQRMLFGARDHLGIKPLYYYNSSNGLYFASEAKAILAVRPETRNIRWEVLPKYLAFLWVPGAETMFSSILALEPGTWLQFKEGNVETGVYWDVIKLYAEAEPDHASYAERKEKFRGLLHSAVHDQRISSDVPLGLLLSGGLDSTTLLAEMSHESATTAYTATYSEKSRAGDVFDDDAKYARIAADKYHATLQEELLEADIVSILPKVIWHLDEPMADPTVLTNYELTKAARSSLRVLLSGMGADEILGGYPRYVATIFGKYFSFLPSAVPKLTSYTVKKALTFNLLPISKVRRFLYLLECGPEPFPKRFLGFSSYLSPTEQLHLLSEAILEVANPFTAFSFHTELLQRLKHLPMLQQMLAVDVRTFLPYLNLAGMDKTSMAHSVEMRVPFLDRQLVEYSMSLPVTDKVHGRIRKTILRDAYEKELPLSIKKRRKTGYSPPIRGWVRNELKEYVQDSLLSPNSILSDQLNQSYVNRLVQENNNGIRDNSMSIWLLLVLAEWKRIFIDHASFAEPLDIASLRLIS